MSQSTAPMRDEPDKSAPDTSTLRSAALSNCVRCIDACCDVTVKSLRDMTQTYVWRDSTFCSWLGSNICVTLLIPIYSAQHRPVELCPLHRCLLWHVSPYSVWHDWNVQVTWLSILRDFHIESRHTYGIRVPSVISHISHASRTIRHITHVIIESHQSHHTYDDRVPSVIAHISHASRTISHITHMIVESHQSRPTYAMIESHQS